MCTDFNTDIYTGMCFMHLMVLKLSFSFLLVPENVENSLNSQYHKSVNFDPRRMKSLMIYLSESWVSSFKCTL